VTSTEPNMPTTYKRYLGTYKSPDFLTAGETDPSVLRRDGTATRRCRGCATRSSPRSSGVRGDPAAAAPDDRVRPRSVGSAKEYLSDNFVGSLARTTA